MRPSLKEICVGIIGFGTVGAGTAKLLVENAELLRRRVQATDEREGTTNT